MAFATVAVLFIKTLVGWILLQWVLELLVPRAPRAKRVLSFIRSANSYITTAVLTFGALLVLLPSLLFVTLEVFDHVRSSIDWRPAKSLSDYVTRGVRVINELETLGERMRHAASELGTSDREVLQKEPASSADPAVLPQSCGDVLLAICRHSESLERLYMALQPPEVDELIYCDCEDFEIRGEKVISLIGMLRECMERQTEVVQAVDTLCPMIPVTSLSPSEENVDDSGFIDC